MKKCRWERFSQSKNENGTLYRNTRFFFFTISKHVIKHLWFEKVDFFFVVLCLQLQRAANSVCKMARRNGCGRMKGRVKKRKTDVYVKELPL